MTEPQTEAPKKSLITQVFLKYQGRIYLLFAAAQFFSILLGLQIVSAPLNPAAPQEKTLIVIPKGANFSQVTQLLEQKNLLQYPRFFYFYTKIKGLTGQIQAGEFEIPNHWTLGQLLNHLVAGTTRLYSFTIPEGYNLREVAQRLEDSKMWSKSRFLALANDLCDSPEIRSLLSWNLCDSRKTPLSAEGFLFPETYHFAKEASELSILKTMLREFFKNYETDWKKRTKELGMTPYELLILASMIEKETGIDTDRPLISSVFHNRLKRKMRLESDPTVIYGIPQFNGNLTRKNLRSFTPYNTYVIKRLPPTPIANPGKASLYSALYPAKANYLFFVARGNGSSQFSTTLADHNRAVRKYQIKSKSKK